MASPDWSAAFEVLQDRHRRRVLLALFEHNPQEVLPVPEGVHTGEVDLRTLQIAMYHSHLPLLAEKGYIDWDRETHQVRKGPRFAEIKPLLEFLDDHQEEVPNGLA